MKYVHVTNGVVDSEPMELPNNYKNISGLKRATPFELKELGWYQVTNFNNVVFDARKKRINGFTADFNKGQPIITYNLVDIPQQEIFDNDLRKWEDQMQTSDATLMSRALEKHIEVDHNGITNDPDLQNKYNQKKALRNTKPIKQIV